MKRIAIWTARKRRAPNNLWLVSLRDELLDERLYRFRSALMLPHRFPTPTQSLIGGKRLRPMSPTIVKLSSDYREKRGRKLVSLWDKFRQSDGNLAIFWLMTNLDQLNSGTSRASFCGTFTTRRPARLGGISHPCS
jgi:hypothetical protein